MSIRVCRVLHEEKWKLNFRIPRLDFPPHTRQTSPLGFDLNITVSGRFAYTHTHTHNRCVFGTISPSCIPSDNIQYNTVITSPRTAGPLPSFRNDVCVRATAHDWAVRSPFDCPMYMITINRKYKRGELTRTFNKLALSYYCL